MPNEEGLIVCDPCLRNKKVKIEAKEFCTKCCENICQGCINIHKLFPALQQHHLTECVSKGISERTEKRIDKNQETGRANNQPKAGTVGSSEKTTATAGIERSNGQTESKSEAAKNNIYRSVKPTTKITTQAARNTGNIATGSSSGSSTTTSASTTRTTRTEVAPSPGNTAKTTGPPPRNVGTTGRPPPGKTGTTAGPTTRNKQMATGTTARNNKPSTTSQGRTSQTGSGPPGRKAETSAKSAQMQSGLPPRNAKIVAGTSTKTTEQPTESAAEITETSQSDAVKGNATVPHSTGVDAAAPDEESDKHEAPNTESSTTTGRNAAQGPLTASAVIGQYDIKTKGDVDSPDIYGAVLLPGGMAVLCDVSNNKLKLLNNKHSVVDTFDISEPNPWGLCAIGEDICLAAEESLFFLKVKPRMELTRRFSVGVRCRGVGYSGGHLYVACGGGGKEGAGHVRVLTTAGRLESTWEKDNDSNQHIFTVPLDIAISADGEKIHVADNNNGIITFNKQGDILWRFCDMFLRHCHGCCADSRDRVYVCGYWFHNVIQLDTNGKKLRTLLTRKNGIERPLSVCFDAARGRLLVGMYHASHVKVFHVD